MIDLPPGAWQSPISAEVVVEKALRLGAVVTDGEVLYWTEGRPAEKGRNALMRYSQGKKEQLLDEHNVRTRVHEYGGGAFTAKGGLVVFISDKTQSLYCLNGAGEVTQLTPTDNRRYAEPVIDLERQAVYAICEEHGDEVENYIVQVDLIGKQPPKKLVFGNDFYSTIRLSPDGTKFSYLTWNHPNLPWDASELYIYTFDRENQKIAGGDSSISLPEWSPEGDLYFADDKAGFWSLYRFDGNRIEPITTEIEADFGEPEWVFGCTRILCEENAIFAVYTVKGCDHLGVLDPKTKKLIDLNLPFTYIRSPRKLGDKIAFTAASATTPSALYIFDPDNLETTPIQWSKTNTLEEELISTPQTISFPTHDGKKVYGFYYAPKNPNVAQTDKKPPLIVRCHGGPTSHTPAIFSLMTQFWTTRGFAVLDVNYGGSAGYGRDYRKRLNGNWGIVDVQDAIAGAKYLVEKGVADPNKLAIRGGSAGGYTTLAALAFEDYFQAGCSLFGICDLELLDDENHKFEKHYNHTLIGPYPETEALYKERSPIHKIDNLQTPLLILQGDEDLIVPPDQAETVANALENNGTPYAYILFEGEQHGFRQSKNIKRALEAEHSFYCQIFGIPLPKNEEKLEIKNF